MINDLNFPCGHPRSPGNQRPTSQGYKDCLTCYRTWQKEHGRKQRAAARHYRDLGLNADVNVAAVLEVSDGVVRDTVSGEVLAVDREGRSEVNDAVAGAFLLRLLDARNEQR